MDREGETVMTGISDNEAIKFKKLIMKIVADVIKGTAPSGATRATLIGINPLEFRVNAQLFLKGQFLVVPKYQVFTAEDIGKEYVFLKDHTGQTYYWMYEPSTPQGSNGIPYSFSGDIICNLTGTCPDGSVTVTGGTIEKLTHKRQAGG